MALAPLLRARIAVSVLFVVNAFALSTWLPRLAEIQGDLGLNEVAHGVADHPSILCEQHVGPERRIGAARAPIAPEVNVNCLRRRGAVRPADASSARRAGC